MSNAQLGWLVMIGFRHVWTGPIIFHVDSHIHIYVGPAGGRILSVYRRRPLHGQRLPPARLLLPLRRPRGHARCTQKNGPKPGRRSKPERVWGLEILIFGASRQPGKPVVAIGQFSFDRRGWDAEGKATLGGTRKCLAGVGEVAGRSSDFLPQFSAFEVTEKTPIKLFGQAILERMWPTPVATAEDPAGNQLMSVDLGLDKSRPWAATCLQGTKKSTHVFFQPDSVGPLGFREG